MAGGGKAAHIQADLANDDFRAERAYTGDAAEELDGGTKGRQIGLDLLIDRRDGGIKVVDLSEMKTQ